ncbi:MAG: YHS domain-containing protein, partial [Burkholderiaceae bacterium]|nr:YHS domain-containing protein [Burkholderiaceae bacterium]
MNRTALLLDAAADDAQATVDPVCGMTVEPAKAAGRAEHRGRTYLFCSGHCLSEFGEDPDRYAAGSAATTKASAPVQPDPHGHDGQPLQTVL